jgi:hypothetical protein
MQAANSTELGLIQPSEAASLAFWNVALDVVCVGRAERLYSADGVRALATGGTDPFRPDQLPAPEKAARKVTFL